MTTFLVEPAGNDCNLRVWKLSNPSPIELVNTLADKENQENIIFDKDVNGHINQVFELLQLIPENTSKIVIEEDTGFTPRLMAENCKRIAKEIHMLSITSKGFEIKALF
jgi:hypothetical protein